MLWLEIICLKFRFALHIYFRTSFNYLTSQERKTMTETAPASTDLHGNIASALPCQQLTGTSITTRTQPFGRVGTNRSGKCLQEALSLCVRAINIHKNLTVYNQPYKTVITVAYTSRRPTSWSRGSLTNNSSEAQKIPLFLRY